MDQTHFGHFNNEGYSIHLAHNHDKRWANFASGKQKYVSTFVINGYARWIWKWLHSVFFGEFATRKRKFPFTDRKFPRWPYLIAEHVPYISNGKAVHLSWDRIGWLTRFAFPRGASLVQASSMRAVFLPLLVVSVLADKPLIINNGGQSFLSLSPFTYCLTLRNLHPLEHILTHSLSPVDLIIQRAFHRPKCNIILRH